MAPDVVQLPQGTFEFDGTEFPGVFKTARLHPTRNLTDVSRRRIAAFQCGSKVAIARQIGNAVAVLLAREIGRAIARMYALGRGQADVLVVDRPVG